MFHVGYGVFVAWSCKVPSNADWVSHFLVEVAIHQKVAVIIINREVPINYLIVIRCGEFRVSRLQPLILMEVVVNYLITLARHQVPDYPGHLVGPPW